MSSFTPPLRKQNARPARRQSFATASRCLIVADGFYEWKKSAKATQPYLLRIGTGKPFAFAGLAEHWRRGDLAIDSCTVITTEPNSLAAAIHDRMPVILGAEDYDAWPSPASDPAEVVRLLRP